MSIKIVTDSTCDLPRELIHFILVKFLMPINISALI